MDNKSLDYYKQAYEELKLILDMSYDQITIADGDGVFRRVSKSCEPYFGVEENGLVGVSAFELEKQGIFDTSVTAEVLRQNRKVTLIQKTGSDKILMVTGMPILDREGKIIKIVNISKDITENQNLGLELKEIQGKLEWFKKELNKRENIYNSDLNYKSQSMQKIMELILRIADIDATVLLLGETGVGKGYISRIIHDSSNRKNEPFVPINCGAIPENLLESELFGYEGGAFSGANKGGKKGLFEIAGKGTIFLDEIGDMPLNLQVKLLHVLEEKQVFRVGGEKPIPIHARLLAATNKDLEKLISEGKFREDLYYRLNVVPVTIPPLRERKEDLPGLIKQVLKKYNKEYNTDKSITEEGYKLLIDYDYKGNIRELNNIIERLIITTSGDIIEGFNIKEIIDLPRDRTGKVEIKPLKEAVEELERKILLSAFEEYKTTRRVAEVLDIDQSTVVKKSQRLKLK